MVRKGGGVKGSMGNFGLGWYQSDILILIDQFNYKKRIFNTLSIIGKGPI